MATQFLTVPRASIQAKLAIQPPPDFNMALVAESATEQLFACTASAGLSAKVDAWLNAGSVQPEGDLESITVIPPGFDPVGFPGSSITEIIDEMEPNPIP